MKTVIANRQKNSTPFALICSHYIMLCALILIVALSPLHNAYSTTSGKGIGGTGKQASNIGGTGKQQREKGIGGTGKTADKGIGGTGKQFVEGSGIGGTGIIGTISAISNTNTIKVNGIQVTLDSATALYINRVRSNTNKLRIGQRVALYANKNNRRLIAKRIDVNYDLIAVIQFTNRQRYSFLAAGQTVLLHKSIRQQIRNAKPGRTVFVSGLRKNNGTLIATAVSFNNSKLRLSHNKVQVSGRLRKFGRNSYYLNGLSIKVKSGQYVKLNNRMVTVTGRQTKKGFQVQKITRRPTIPFGGSYKHLLLEGYLSKSLNPNILSLNGTSIFLNNKTNILGAPKAQLVTDTRVYIDVYLDSSNRLTADSVRFSTDRFDRRDVITPSQKDGKNNEVGSSDDNIKSKEKNQNNNDDNKNDDRNSFGNDDANANDDANGDANDDNSSESKEAPEAPEPPEPPEPAQS